MQSIKFTDESESQQGGVVRFVHGSDAPIDFSKINLSNLSYDELREILRLAEKHPEVFDAIDKNEFQ